MKVTAQVAAHLDTNPTVEARAIRSRPLDQKPYWDLERGRIGETRKIPVEVLVNGQPVAKTEVTADGNIEGVSFDVPIQKSSWVALRVFPSSHTNPVFVVGRRQADPRLEEVGRVVRQGGRPVLVAEGEGHPGPREGGRQEGVRRRPRCVQAHLDRRARGIEARWRGTPPV